MLAYHHDRLQSDSIPSLRAILKSIDDDAFPRETSGIAINLSSLRELLFGEVGPGQSTIEKHDDLCTITYELRTTKSIEEALYTSSKATSKMKKLWVEVCMLSKFRVTFLKFCEIALKLPSFSEVIIILLPRQGLSVRPLEVPLSLKQTFESLKLSLGSETVQNVIGPKWRPAKAEVEFTKSQKRKLNVHAEVQMLLYLCTHEPSSSTVLPYFGCSKLACFMCFHLLQGYGRFEMRGCHGRLFKPWTIPENRAMASNQVGRMTKAVNHLQRRVRKELLSKVPKQGRQEKTSVVGGSSIAVGYQGEGLQRKSEIERLRLKSEQTRVAESFKR